MSIAAYVITVVSPEIFHVIPFPNYVEIDWPVK